MINILLIILIIVVFFNFSLSLSPIGNLLYPPKNANIDIEIPIPEYYIKQKDIDNQITFMIEIYDDYIKDIDSEICTTIFFPIHVDRNETLCNLTVSTTFQGILDNIGTYKMILYDKKLGINHDNVDISFFSMNYKRVITPTQLITVDSNKKALKASISLGRGSYVGDKFDNIIHITVPTINWIIEIGNFCSFAPNFQIFISHSTYDYIPNAHDYNFISSYPFADMEYVMKKKINEEKLHPLEIYPNNAKTIIGHDVWVGNEVVIINGVTIGHGALVGAYSVVRESIPPYAIVHGNPAVVIKFRFTQEQIQYLLQVQWWNWTDDEIFDMPLTRDFDNFVIYVNKIRPKIASTSNIEL
jgi:acetyltransferase-like isoleucine patch superfamily enzyme